VSEFHRCFIPIFIYTLLQPEGQTGEAWRHFRKQSYLENRGILKRNLFSLSFVFTFTGLMQVEPVLARQNTRHKVGSGFYARLHCREKRLLASPCPSVCLSTCVSTSATGRISSKFDIGGGGDIMKICGENPNWVKVGQKYWALYNKTI